MNRKDFITNTSLAGISALCIPDLLIGTKSYSGIITKSTGSINAGVRQISAAILLRIVMKWFRIVWEGSYC